MTFMDKFQEVGGKVAGQRHLLAVRDGILLSLPATIAGSIFLIIRFLPIPGFENFMAGIFGQSWGDAFLYPVAATFDLIGLIACFGISYRLAEGYKLDSVTAAVVALIGYFSLVPSNISVNIANMEAATVVGGVWSMEYTGARSLIVVIMVSIASVEIFRFITKKGLVLKLPEMVPPNVAKSFTAIIPALIVLFVMWIIRIVFSATVYKTFHAFINAFITAPLTKVGGSFAGMSIMIFFKDLFWTLGIHGPNAMSPVMVPLLRIFTDANRLAYEAGQQLPYLFTQSGIEIFTQIGGSGNTLAFTIMCAFFAKSRQLKQIGRLALGPAIFQINEPIIFGVPVVLNPIMMVPFILSSFVGVLFMWLGDITGLVARLPGIIIPWTMPSFINVYIAGGGKLSPLVLQIVVFIVTVFIWAPFFRILDNNAYKQETGQM